MLRDSASLALDHLGVQNRVQQRRFTVVDMPHHRDDWRPRRSVFRRFVQALHRSGVNLPALERDV